MDFYNTAATIAYNYQQEFAVVVGVSMLLAISYLHRKGRKEWRRMLRRAGFLKGKTMNKRDYQEHLKTIKGDAIFNALEDLVEAGKITRHDCTKTLRSISGILNIPGFVSQEKFDLTSLTLEEFSTVQSVLRSKKQLKKLIFDTKKVHIPGPEDVIPIDRRLSERAKELAENGKIEAMREALQPRKVFGGTLLKRKTAIV